MLTIRSSNRAEALLALLRQHTKTSLPADPFAADHIIVPSVAVRTLIQNDLASEFGICANVRFSFLAQWLWEQIGRLVHVSTESPFATEVLVWRIYGLLSEREFVAPFPRLASYLERADPVMQFELAGRIASLFDKYTTYRPQWLADWLEGKPARLQNASDDLLQDQSWQMALWVRIASDLDLKTQHPFTEFMVRMRNMAPGELERRGIPSRVSIFMLPSIPPLYLTLLRQLGQHIDIDLYLLNPCSEYWFEIVDPRRIRYLQLKAMTAANEDTQDHHEVGNRLLAMWGRQSQSMISMLLDQAEPEAIVDDMLVVNTLEQSETGSLLQVVQQSILALEDMQPGSPEAVAAQAQDAEHGRSIDVHVCHTMTRELEVLHDQLLHLFNSANPPRPSEVLVVVPDLEKAAPLIDTVFGSAEGQRRIAYGITGRPGSAVNPVSAALLALLAIVSSRYSASAVFGLLQNPLIRARFNIAPDQLDTVQEWLPQAGIHWGLDAEHRAGFGAPHEQRHTFRDGIDRLFLGYALPAEVEQPFNAMLAPCHTEGSEGMVLGCLSDFLERLRRLEATLAKPATASAWQETLLALLNEFIQCGPDQLDDLAEVRKGIVTLTQSIASGGLHAQLPISVIKTALQQALDQPARGGTPTGGVTFSAIASLRNLPYSVICMLGMHDGAFPATERPLEFDLMTVDVQRGDRQKRDEERNLFLDLLLAARSKLYISYCGRSVRDNAPLPPSVLVSDLLDLLAEATASDPDDVKSVQRARAALIVEHPLQPFSESYFDGSDARRLFSYHDDYCQALKARSAQAVKAAMSQTVATTGITTVTSASAINNEEAGDGASAGYSDGADTDDGQGDEIAEPLPLFFPSPLPAPEPEWRSVTLDDLVDFFKNPCKRLLKKRLRLTLPDDVTELADDESFLPDPLAKMRLAQRLLPQMLAGADIDAVTTLAQAGLEFPCGPVGRVMLAREIDTMGDFAASVREHQTGALLQPLSGKLICELENEIWTLQGGLADVRANGLVRYRYANVKPADYLSAWLHHLWLCHIAPTELHHTTWVARDYEIVLQPVADAAYHLQKLLALYRLGLCQPLHFFPKSAWDYIKSEGNMNRANGTWKGRPGMPGERDDAAFKLALRGVENPLDQAFSNAAMTVFGQMLNYLATEPV